MLIMLLILLTVRIMLNLNNAFATTFFAGFLPSFKLFVLSCIELVYAGALRAAFYTCGLKLLALYKNFVVVVVVIQF